MSLTEVSKLSESLQNPKVVITGKIHLNTITFPVRVRESTFSLLPLGRYLIVLLDFVIIQ